MGSDVWGKAEVYRDDQPCGKVSLVENGKAIKREAEGDIVFVLKVFVIEHLTINPNKLFAEFTVEISVEHVGYGVRMFA